MKRKKEKKKIKGKEKKRKIKERKKQTQKKGVHPRRYKQYQIDIHQRRSKLTRRLQSECLCCLRT